MPSGANPFWAACNLSSFFAVRTRLELPVQAKGKGDLCFADHIVENIDPPVLQFVQAEIVNPPADELFHPLKTSRSIRWGISSLSVEILSL
jgi:hypothetical protein